MSVIGGIVFVLMLFLILFLILKPIVSLIIRIIRKKNNTDLSSQFSSVNYTPEVQTILTTTIPQTSIIEDKNTINTVKETIDISSESETSNVSNIIDNTYLSIILKIKNERGFSIFENYGKCKSLLQDYTAGNYKKECRLLLVAIEAGCASEISNSTEQEITSQKLIKKLQDDFSLSASSAEQIVVLLYNVYNEGEKNDL
jgi:hypothetical protein